ncbi:hypothetical protein B4113_1620 [Geobacillus sp. B4113_201601]|nr:hypothetical protein B4113_1620 [Geobacillus sp. B4113_201601]
MVGRPSFVSGRDSAARWTAANLFFRLGCFGALANKQGKVYS